MFRNLVFRGVWDGAIKIHNPDNPLEGMFLQSKLGWYYPLKFKLATDDPSKLVRAVNLRRYEWNFYEHTLRDIAQRQDSLCC
jgi:hypothetical protein